MSKISKAASLSKLYTNHCVRATCITVLSESGFEARHIVTSSGHKNEQSVQNYVRDTSTAQKRNMSALISSFTNTTVQSNVNNKSSNQTSDQNDSSFDNDISVSDLVMSAPQYDTLMESISRGEAELQPLSDIAYRNNTMTTVPAEGNSSKRPIVFNSFQVTIHMIS